MKNKRLKGVNIVAMVIFTVAFFLNIQSGFHEGHGLLGIVAIGQGTGSGSGDTTGSGSGSGSGNGRFPSVPIPCDCDTFVYAWQNWCLPGNGICVPTECPPKPGDCP